MNKKDLADVLVKLSGFGFVIGGIYSASTNVIAMFTTGAAHPTAFGSHEYNFTVFLAPMFSIVFGTYLIRRSGEITSWLFRDDEP
jgi:hypothetical protein